MNIEIWTIYDHPKDFPNDYVVRRVCVGEDGVLRFDQEAVVTSTLEAARNAVPPGKICLPRWIEDDPVILECWL